MRSRAPSDATRLIALLSALGLLCFNAGVSLALWSYSELLESASSSSASRDAGASVGTSRSSDPPEEATIAALLASFGSRWTLLNAIVCLFGVYGALMKRPRALRVFAVGSTVDAVLFVFVVFVMALVTFSPALSGPFSSMLCNELTRGEIFGFAAWFNESQRHAESAGPSLRGVEILSYGVENCEDNWRSIMVVFLVLAMLGGATRLWTLCVSCEYIRRLETSRSNDYFGDYVADEKSLRSGRRKSSSMSRVQSATPTSRCRQSRSESAPKLVYVPVMYDPTSSQVSLVASPDSLPPSPRSVVSFGRRSPSPSEASSRSDGSVTMGRPHLHAHLQQLSSKRRTSVPPPSPGSPSATPPSPSAATQSQDCCAHCPMTTAMAQTDEERLPGSLARARTRSTDGWSSDAMMV